MVTYWRSFAASFRARASHRMGAVEVGGSGMCPGADATPALDGATPDSRSIASRMVRARLAGVLMSLNDPQWGRRGGNQGPPDLDELMRNFKQKLGSLFGRKGGGNGGAPGGPGLAQFGGGAGILIGLVVLVWLASGFYIVDASQRGIVLRFGKYVEETQPGPRWHLPYPIETAEVVSVSQVRTVEIGYRNTVKSKVPKESLMLTDDENISRYPVRGAVCAEGSQGLSVQ